MGREVTRAEVYGSKSMPRRRGRGPYAPAQMEACPDLPFEGEGRLNDSKRRGSFMGHVLAHQLRGHLFRRCWTHGQVVAFHTAPRLQRMAHSTVANRDRGRPAVPVSPIAHHVRHHEVEYLHGRTFLEPAPSELMLRNHV